MCLLLSSCESLLKLLWGVHLYLQQRHSYLCLMSWWTSLSTCGEGKLSRFWRELSSAIGASGFFDVSAKTRWVHSSWLAQQNCFSEITVICVRLFFRCGMQGSFLHVVSFHLSNCSMSSSLDVMSIKTHLSLRMVAFLELHYKAPLEFLQVLGSPFELQVCLLSCLWQVSRL